MGLRNKAVIATLVDYRGLKVSVFLVNEVSKQSFLNLYVESADN